MRLDRDNKYGKEADKENKIKSIKDYFSNVENEVRNIDDEEIKNEFLNIIHNAQKVLDVCDFWENIIDELVDDQEEVFRKYFILEGIYDCRAIAFDSVDNMKQALSVLYHFYMLHRENDILKYSSILLQMSIEFIRRCEVFGSESLFEGQGKEIGELLDKAAGVIYQAYPHLNRDAQDMVNRIRVYVYKFKGYVKDGADS